ncbi:LuxR family transcriptional regulator [Actinoplanes sichuanensis]|uniref:AAA family ATPase n=1 Tax=Actinoplanes sichuanensis TaxID=512349 RepID=A0ABW4A5U4_9ACTN|nr:AAA family ATPase [Actinoplanes sichuanensis]BEL03207.1 LuxR family transcriptional regulator [Actinoplanes sichuanensis]
MENSLVGRQAELAVLRAALDRSARGPVVVAISGDPGIGKTRLLGELGADGSRRGCLVLAGRAAEFEREVPFGTVKNALADHVGSWSEALDDADVRLLGTVFPGLVRPDDTAGPPLLPGERYRVHRAVRALLEAMASDSGLVLILDDLHWSDEGSLELLDHLLRHPPRGGVLVALAYRPRQVEARLGRAVAAAVQRGLATVVTVGPFSRAEADALLPAGLSPSRLRQLYEASAGNPFHLELLARGPDDGEAALPAALAGEFSGLDRLHRRILYAAAVAGDDVDVGLLAAVADLPLSDVLPALDDLTGRDLIRPYGTGGAFRFRHPLLRSAAYQQAGAGWRLAAHARAARELGRRGAPVADRATHVQASAPVGDLAAVRLLQAAAMDAMRITPAAAAHWLQAALRLLPGEPGTVDTRLELLNLRAQALGITGRLAESRELFGQILAMLPSGTEPRVAVVSFLTMVQHLLGEHGEARALVLREMQQWPDHGSAAAAGALRVAQALTTLMSGPAEDTAVEAAIGTARETGSRALLAAALGVGVVASQAFGRPGGQARAWLDEAAELIDAMPDQEVAQRLDTALFLGWGELYLERYPAALRHLQRALHVARATGQSHLIGSLQTIEAVAHCATGDLPRALSALDDAMESVVLTGGRDAYPRVLGYQCWARVWTGDVDEALTLGEQAVALARGRSVQDWQSAVAEGMLGWARYAAGDPDGCSEVMLEAGRGPDLPAVRPLWQPRWFEVLTAAAAAAGDRRRAADLAARAARLPAIAGRPRRAGMIAMAQVHAGLHVDPQAAAGHAVRAAALFTRAGDRLGTAQALFYSAVAHREIGDPDEAARAVVAARLKLAGCGARPHWLARATGIALDDEAPARRDDPAKTYGITVRESDVLALLAESLTAAAIARRLGISAGTVHKHLAALYRKLGTGDRLATVLRARALGLVAADGEG